jgi:hypothetical protein
MRPAQQKPELIIAIVTGDSGRLMIEIIWIDAFYPKTWPYLAVGTFDHSKDDTARIYLFFEYCNPRELSNRIKALLQNTSDEFLEGPSRQCSSCTGCCEGEPVS